MEISCKHKDNKIHYQVSRIKILPVIYIYITWCILPKMFLKDLLMTEYGVLKLLLCLKSEPSMDSIHIINSMGNPIKVMLIIHVPFKRYLEE